MTVEERLTAAGKDPATEPCLWRGMCDVCGAYRWLRVDPKGYVCSDECLSALTVRKG